MMMVLVMMMMSNPDSPSPRNEPYTEPLAHYTDAFIGAKKLYFLPHFRLWLRLTANRRVMREKKHTHLFRFYKTMQPSEEKDDPGEHLGCFYAQVG